MRLSSVRRARLIIFGCLALGLAVTGVCLGARQAAAPDVDALTQELDRLSQQKQDVQQKLRAVKQSQRQVSRRLTVIDSQLGRTEAHLNQVAADVRHAQAELARATDEYRLAETYLARHQQTVAERLVAIYKQGELRPVEVILHSTSFTDFANRLYLLNQIIGSDAQLLAEFRRAQEQARERRAVVAERGRRLAQLQQQIISEKGRVSAERATTERQKQRLLRDRAAWERALAELEADSRDIEAMLQRMQRTPDGQARLTKPLEGQLRQPVAGRISSRFGYRMHPIFRVRKMHTGIDIAASQGTSIRAAGAGTVVFAGKWGGYGNCAIIDHGGGLATLYAHCSRLAVNENQTVSQGQTIGYVGSTGLATGPHLHFEVRRNGRPVDPMPFL
jgi:murein DD-endopeptidase MepM/ murein hydrolase activator NlpD